MFVSEIEDHNINKLEYNFHFFRNGFLKLMKNTSLIKKIFPVSIQILIVLFYVFPVKAQTPITRQFQGDVSVPSPSSIDSCDSLEIRLYSVNNNGDSGEMLWGTQAEGDLGNCTYSFSYSEEDPFRSSYVIVASDIPDGVFFILGTYGAIRIENAQDINNVNIRTVFRNWLMPTFPILP